MTISVAEYIIRVKYGHSPSLIEMETKRTKKCKTRREKHGRDQKSDNTNEESSSHTFTLTLLC